MDANNFRADLLAHFDEFQSTLATDRGDWIVKGSILLHEKWHIASDRPGSGNTKNIGSARNIQALVEGNGPFALHGPEVFDDYRMNYLTEDMAQAIGSDVPYRNLEEYWQWRDRVALKSKRKRK